jgi:hypothetical protein
MIGIDHIIHYPTADVPGSIPKCRDEVRNSLRTGLRWFDQKINLHEWAVQLRRTSPRPHAAVFIAAIGPTR